MLLPSPVFRFFAFSPFLATHAETPRVQTQNGIDYVAGGIGKEQADAMKVAAQEYDLMLTFATDGGKYLAGMICKSRT